jgi:hypothetical protein
MQGVCRTEKLIEGEEASRRRMRMRGELNFVMKVAKTRSM